MSFQTSNTEALTLPVPGDILQIIIVFLYTDDAPAVTGKRSTCLTLNCMVTKISFTKHWVGTMKVTQVTIITFFVNKSICLKWWSPEYGVAEGIQ